MSRAADIHAIVESVVAPISAIKDSGLNSLFLRYEQPFDPQDPQIAQIDPNRPFQGVLTSDQYAVVKDVLAERHLGVTPLPFNYVITTHRIDIFSKQDRIITIYAARAPDKVLSVKVTGKDYSVFHIQPITPGQTVILCSPGEDKDSIRISFATISGG